MKLIWMCMIEEEEGDIVRELQMEAFVNPNGVWNKLNKYSETKMGLKFLDFINDDEPFDFNDPETYVWTWNIMVENEEIRINVLRMPLIEGEEDGRTES